MQNIRFLSPAAKLILYMGLTEPSGRFPSFGNIEAMRTLRRYNLVKPEDVYALDRGDMVAVSPDLYAVRDHVISVLKETLEKSLKTNLNDPLAVTQKFNELLQQESSSVW